MQKLQSNYVKSFCVRVTILSLCMYSHVAYAAGKCRIVLATELPGPNAKALIAQQAKIESSAISYPTRYPLVPKIAKGSFIEDVDGNIFLDFFTMAGALPLGHNPPELRTFNRASQSLTTTLDFPTQDRVNFLSAIQQQAALILRENAVIHLSGPTGTDAVEAALKLARWKTGNEVILSFTGAYHGMTAGSSAVTFGTSPTTWRTPRQSSEFLKFPRTADEAEQVLRDADDTLTRLTREGKKVAAAIIEPIQGEGGSVVPPENFLARLVEILHNHGALVIADEVQCGFARSGYFFASEGFPGFHPDILVFSKAASGVGAPLGGIAFTSKLNGWPIGSSIGTFRGFVPAFASGAKTIEKLSDPTFLSEVTKKGAWALGKLKSELSDSKVVKSIQGRGLMMGIEIVNPLTAQPDTKRALAIAQSIFRHGVIVEIGGINDNVIRLLPPLNIKQSDLETGIKIIESVVLEHSRN